MSQSGESTPALSGNDGLQLEALEFDSPVGPSNTEQPAEPNASSSPIPQQRARSSSNTVTKPKWWHSQFNMMLAVFGLLAATALLFIALTPPPESNQAAIIEASNQAASSTSSLPSSEAPWTKSQQAEARSESQAILSNLLDSKKSLEAKDVLLWAPDRYQQALDTASSGDEFYQQQDYQQAIGNYQSAVDQIDSLFDLLPEIISTKLSAGEAAIVEGKSDLAKQQFSEVLTLDKNNLPAASGLDRASKLDQVLSLIAQASATQSRFVESNDIEELISAEKTLVQAQLIDPKFSAVDQALVNVRASIVDRRFAMAMSEAYRSLFANRNSAARQGFNRALKIKPGDKSAAAAIQQSVASDTTASLSSLLADAKSYEAQEQWASAAANYQTVLQRDPNQVNAKLGNIRSGARAKLDGQLRDVLADPLALSRTEQRENATKILADAQAIRSKGPLLSEQISSLDDAIKQTDAVIKVSISSDSLTEISLQKVGAKEIKLGKFSQKKLALKSGRYIAKGVRLGYRDVRTEIELYSNDGKVQSINIQCDQRVGS